MKNKDKDMTTLAGHSDAYSYASAVPQDKSLREFIQCRVQHAIRQENLIPPLSLEELSNHADNIIQQIRIPAGYKDFVTVLVGNAVWEDTMAANIAESLEGADETLVSLTGNGHIINKFGVPDRTTARVPAEMATVLLMPIQEGLIIAKNSADYVWLTGNYPQRKSFIHPGHHQKK